MCPDCVRLESLRQISADLSYTNPVVLRDPTTRMVIGSDDPVAIRTESVRRNDHAVSWLFACGFIPACLVKRRHS